MRELSYLEAIREALQQEMRRDPRVFVIGEDVGVYGGAFGVTRGLVEEFGEQRIIDTPISELGIAGAIYEIGALCALEDSLHGLDFNRCEHYIGVSAGGFIAAGLANGRTQPVALVPVHEMGRGVDVNGPAGGFEHGPQIGGHRSLAIGAGDMKDRRHALLWIAELLEQAQDHDEDDEPERVERIDSPQPGAVVALAAHDQASSGSSKP